MVNLVVNFNQVQKRPAISEPANSSPFRQNARRDLVYHQLFLVISEFDKNTGCQCQWQNLGLKLRPMHLTSTYNWSNSVINRSQIAEFYSCLWSDIESMTYLAHRGENNVRKVKLCNFISTHFAWPHQLVYCGLSIYEKCGRRHFSTFEKST